MLKFNLDVRVVLYFMIFVLNKNIALYYIVIS